MLTGCLAAGLAGGWAAAWAARRLAEEAMPRWLEPALAAAGAVLAGWAWAVTPPGPVLLASLLLAWGLVVLATVDVAVLRLPDLVTLPLAALGLLMAWKLPAADGLVSHLAGAAGGYAVLALIAWAFHRLRGQEGIGMGDAKLLATAGAWLGWASLPSVLLLGCMGGLAWWSLGRLAGSREPRIPFGAPLCAAFWLAWLYGPLIPA